MRADRRPRQQPPQPPALQAARDPAGGVGHRPDPAPDRARGPRVRTGAAARARGGAPRDHRARGRPGLAGGRPRVQDVVLPDGSLIISVLRGGAGFVPKADSVIEAGDQVLLILDPGLEGDITPRFAPKAGPPRLPQMPDRKVDYLLVGGGLAAGNCARWLRQSGADGSILLVGREPDLPYDRPPCSKGYLRATSRATTRCSDRRVVRASSEIEALTRTSVMKLDLGGADGRGCRTSRSSTSPGAARHRSQRPAAERRPGRSSRESTTCGRSATRRDPRRCGGQAGGADRRLLHRQRGRRFADRARQRLHDGDDRAGRARAAFRPEAARFFHDRSRSTASSSTATTSSTASRAPTGASPAS